jgi:hypothetical protein
LLLYSSKPSLGVYQLAGHLLEANKFSDTIITAPSLRCSWTWTPAKCNLLAIQDGIGPLAAKDTNEATS